MIQTFDITMNVIDIERHFDAAYNNQTKGI